MQTPTRLMTYEEYLELPYLGRRTEFVDGRVIELNPPGPLHNEIAETLFIWLRSYFITNGLPYRCKDDLQIEIPPVINRGRGREPDLVVCTKDQWAEIMSSGQPSFRLGNPPLIAIEILSPSNWRQDMKEKQAEYARAGVPEYWRINPWEKWVEVLQLNKNSTYKVKRFKGDTNIESGELPQLGLAAKQILEV
ncbi:MAG: Uma2 family endonuclease [Elainellaceae cyanobacterium]